MKHPVHINLLFICTAALVCLSVVTSWITDKVGWRDHSRRLPFFQGVGVHWDNFIFNKNTCILIFLFIFLAYFLFLFLLFLVWDTEHFYHKAHPTVCGSTPDGKCNLRWSQWGLCKSVNLKLLPWISYLHMVLATIFSWSQLVIPFYGDIWKTVCTEIACTVEPKEELHLSTSESPEVL
jgi:hypothetical protein